MSTKTAPNTMPNLTTWLDALAIFESETQSMGGKLTPSVEAALDLVRGMAQSEQETPLTRHSELSPAELEEALILAAHDLEEAQREFVAAQGAIDSICERHPRLKRRVEDMEVLKEKLDTLKVEIADLRREIVPLEFQKMADEQGVVVDEKRQTLGFLLTEHYHRFPDMEPSDVRLGFVESTDGIYAVHLRKSNEADLKVVNPRRFFATLPFGLERMINVNLTVNTKQASRKEAKETMTLLNRFGMLDGIEKGARIPHFMQEEGTFCTLRKVEDDLRPARTVKLNW